METKHQIIENQIVESMTIGQRIVFVMEKIGLTKSNLAKVSGVDIRQIDKVCAGTSKPSFDLLNSLATQYGINGNWLLIGTGYVFTDKSKLDNPYFQSSVEHCQGERFLLMLDTVIFLQLWIEETLQECRNKLKISREEELKRREQVFRHIKLSIGLKASISINQVEQYFINNTAKAW